MSDDSDPPPLEPEPTRALLLAQALESCIQAERKVPGSADQIIARRPAWMRAELRRLLALAFALDATFTNAVMSDEFRGAARARLMQRIAAITPRPDALDPPRTIASPANRDADEPTGPLPTLPLASPTGANILNLDASPGQLAASTNGTRGSAQAPTTAVARPGRTRRSRWLWRGAIGGVLAAVLAVLATLSASASSLPGQPLYSIKQATEEIGVRFAPDDQARTLMLLRQANARLDETARLLDQGRTDAVADSAQRYDDALDRATSTYVVTMAETAADADAATAAEAEATLTQQGAQLQTMLASAPQPARAELRQALVATERSRALVAAPKPPELVAEAEQSNSGAAVSGGSAPSTNGAASTGATNSTHQPLRTRDALPSAPAPLVASASTTSTTDRVASASHPSAAPPPVDLVPSRPDVTPYVPPEASHVSAGEHEDQPEVVDALQAAPAQAEAGHAQRDVDPSTLSSGRTPADSSRGRRDPQRIEHLNIPALAPPPTVARVRSTSGPSGSDGDSTDVDDTSSVADDQPAVGAQAMGRHVDPSVNAQSGPSVDADDTDADHVVTPSQNQNDTRGRVAVQVTPPPAARQASDADPDDHDAGGPGPALSAQSGGAGSQTTNADAPGGMRATRELAADQRSTASPASPTTGASSAAVPGAVSGRGGPDNSDQAGAASATRDRAASSAVGSMPGSGGSSAGQASAVGGNGASNAGSAGTSNTSNVANTSNANAARSGGAANNDGQPGDGSPSGSSVSSAATSRGAPNVSNGVGNGGGGAPSSSTGSGSNAANGARTNSSGASGGGSQPGGSAASSSGPSGARH